MSLQQLPEETGGGPLIAPRLYKDVDHVAVLVHRAPQLLLPPPNLDEHRVQIPGIAHPAPAAPQPSSVVESEGQAPLPDRFVRNRDPALREEIFDVPKTEAKSMVRPYGVSDDLGWEAVSSVRGRLLAHPFSLPRPA